MTASTEEEAHRLLEEARADLLTKGTAMALVLAEEHGVIHAQMVWAALLDAGMLTHYEQAMPANWLGTIFVGKNRRLWKKAGTIKIGNKERNAHPALRALWRLRADDEPELEDHLVPGLLEAYRLVTDSPDPLAAIGRRIAELQRRTT